MTKIIAILVVELLKVLVKRVDNNVTTEFVEEFKNQIKKEG